MRLNYEPASEPQDQPGAELSLNIPPALTCAYRRNVAECDEGCCPNGEVCCSFSPYFFLFFFFFFVFFFIVIFFVFFVSPLTLTCAYRRNVAECDEGCCPNGEVCCFFVSFSFSSPSSDVRVPEKCC